jgi:hypothetical protein
MMWLAAANGTLSSFECADVQVESVHFCTLTIPTCFVSLLAIRLVHVIAEVYRGLLMGFLEGLQVGQKGEKEKNNTRIKLFNNGMATRNIRRGASGTG